MNAGWLWVPASTQPETLILRSSLNTLSRSTPGTGAMPSFASPITSPATPSRVNVQMNDGRMLPKRRNHLVVACAAYRY